MSESISKDQAVTAMILMDHFEANIEMGAEPTWEKFNEDYTQSGTRYAMLEVAGVVEQIFQQLPEGTRDELLSGDVFQLFALGRFDFTTGPVPTLKGTVEEAAAFLTEEFDLGSSGPTI